MTATPMRAAEAELFELTPATRALLQARMKERHDNRVDDTDGAAWWRVDSADHTGFARLEPRDQNAVRGLYWNGDSRPEGPSYAHLRYDIGTEPLLRSIQVDGLEVGFITRNRYGAAVLNTDLLPMFDIDTKTDEGEMWDPRLDGHYGEHYPVTEVELKQALLELTSQWFGRAMTFEEKFCEGSRAFRELVAAHWPWNDDSDEDAANTGVNVGVNVFSTCNGYRLVLDQPLVITRDNSKAAGDLMKFTYTDDAYRRIAVVQKLWRSRLTKKPWRDAELKGRPLQFEFAVVEGVIHHKPVAPQHPLLQPLWEVLIADNADLHPQKGY
jgi:hypothetical protein